MIITIDGPAGSGKSFLAKNLAKDLGVVHLNSGLLYRASTKLFFEHGLLDDNFQAHISQNLDLLDQIQFTVERQMLRLSFAGVDSEQLHVELSQAFWDPLVAKVAQIEAVREKVVALQRSIAHRTSLVVDGRDCGTLVFPTADCKIFLTASLEVRAQRVAKRNFGIPSAEQVQEIIASVQARDLRDLHRKISPLIPAEDAVILDNSNMDAEQTLIATKQILHAKNLI